MSSSGFINGQILSIYQDWQTSEKHLGDAILLEKVRSGYSFILEDTYSDVYDPEHHYKIPEALTPVYSYERWKVKFVTVTPYGEQSIKLGEIKERNIRYLENIGLSSSSLKEEDNIPFRHSNLNDTFLKVDGVEVF